MAWSKLLKSCSSRPCCQTDQLDAGSGKDAAQDQLVACITDEPTPVVAHCLADIPYSADKQLTERPAVEVAEGAWYQGQWKGPLIHGTGLLCQRDGSKFEGLFSAGKAHGSGKFTALDGHMFVGQWEHDTAHGYGEYVQVDGSAYEGEWVHEEKCGKGVERWADGSRFEGEFLHGVRHGMGTYTSGEGVVVFTGCFQDNKMHGDGVHRFANGRVYSGQWRSDHMHGEGEMSWPDGSKYVGSFRRDVRHGEGTLMLPGGRQYQGQFVEGKPSGFGVMMDAAGAEKACMWKNGSYVQEPEPKGNSSVAVPSQPRLSKTGFNSAPQVRKRSKEAVNLVKVLSGHAPT